MSEPQTWAEALKINPEKLSEWSEQAPADIPLLIWCLQEGQIQAEDYLAWACENFGLPVLNSAFFTQTFDKSTLDPYRADPNYNAWNFPIAFWDDVLFIACAEPPSDPAMGVAYILADPAAMKEIWGVADGELSTSSGSKVANLDMPVGIKTGGGTFVLNLDESTFMKEVPEAIDPTPVKPTENTSLTLSVIQEPKSANAPPPAPAPKKASGTRTNISANGVVEESEVKNAFTTLHRDYQTALIMRCTEGVARPYRWDTQLKIKADDDRFSFNLNLPSFFRIVAKTLQPYHGYVIDSPAHKDFFQALGLPELPGCVTAIPLATTGVMWGMLIAFGGETAQTGDALAYALGVSEKLIKALEPSMSRAA